MRIRAYTLAVHVGHAPCWMNDPLRNCELLTLANCKPKIRDVAQKGEWVAGVTPKGTGYRLAYLMQVDERVTRIQYWERFEKSRLDSIYRPKTNGEWKQMKNPWHWGEESFTRDLSSDWVLLSKDFYVFANSYLEQDTSPSGLRLPARYSGLARGGMRGAGHFIDLPDSFLPWIRKQPRLELADFRVLRDFGEDGCGCCKMD
jgi:hypothetical protein